MPSLQRTTSTFRSSTALPYGRTNSCDGKKGDLDQCLGRSRGGFTTKIHALIDEQGLPIRLSLTAGQAHAGPAAYRLLGRPEPRTIILSDTAYEADGTRSTGGTCLRINAISA